MSILERVGKLTKGWDNAVLGVGMGAAVGIAMRQPVHQVLIDEVAWVIAPQVMAARLGYMMTPSLIEAGMVAYKGAKASYANTFMHNMYGRPFSETEATYTMRQRALAAMRNSKINVNSVLGREASLMHQGMATPPYMRSQRMGW
jgi:hypothetical protein